MIFIKKFTILTTALLLFQYSISASEISYTPTKNQKIEGTFSGDINQKQSIHLIYVKNKTSNTYEIIPFYMDETGRTIALDLVKTTKSPSVVSYHLNQNNLTLILSHKIKKLEQLYIVDFNINTKQNTIAKINKNDNQIVFRLTDKTFIVHELKSSWNITEIQSTNNISTSNIPINKKDLNVFKEVFNSNGELNVDVINTNEYVKNGSIKNTQAFFENGHIIFIHVNKSDHRVNTFNLDLESGTYEFKQHVNNELEKIKNANTYLYKKNLFTILVGKEDAIIKATSLDSGENNFTTSLAYELNKHFDTDIVENYLKQAAKNKNQPTITVNETIENKMALTIDYVNTNVYNYHYDWWFHHWMWQQQIWNQQMMIQNMQRSMPSFGPNPMSFEVSSMEAKTKTKSMVFVLNVNFEIDQSASKKTIKKEIDRDKYLDPIKNDSSLKHATASFQKDSYRYIYYSKSDKKFHLKTAKL